MDQQRSSLFWTINSTFIFTSCIDFFIRWVFRDVIFRNSYLSYCVSVLLYFEKCEREKQFFRKYISLSDVEDILEKEGLEYETEKKETLFCNKYKEIYLPKFCVSIFKIKKRTVVKPGDILLSLKEEASGKFDRILEEFYLFLELT